MPVRRRKDNQNWIIDFTTSTGRRVRKTVSTALTKRQVEAMERDLRRAEEAGPEKKRRGPTYRWGDLAARYWSEHAQHLAWSKAVKCHLTVLSDAIGDATRLDMIDGDLVSEVIASWRGKVADSTINRRLAVMSGAWNRATDLWGWDLPRVPWRRLKLVEPDVEDRSLTEAEQVRLIAECPDHVRHAAMLALMTGLRLAPILQLSWEDVDFERGVISAKSKGRGGGRFTPVGITPELKALLEEIGPRDIGPIITFNGRRLKSIKRAWTNARKRAGLDDVRFHDLRHTFAQMLMDDSGNLSLVTDALHHTNSKTTKRYAHRRLRQVTDAVTQMQQKRKKG